MPRFFIPTEIEEESYLLSGEDARHIGKSLRMKENEMVTLCHPESKMEYEMVILKYLEEGILLKKQQTFLNESEPNKQYHLYQGIPKGSKMEFIIEKSVEVGAVSITPVLTTFCVSRPDKKAVQKKNERYQKIALAAAKQSGRGIIPPVKPQLSFQDAIKEAEKTCDKLILFYEHAEKMPFQADLSDSIEKIAVFIGSEGGFSKEEVAFAESHGAEVLSLGKRILRTETAPIVGLTVLECLFSEFSKK